MSCARLDSSPFVCSSCYKRARCDFAKTRYVAPKAQSLHDERLRLAHLGIACEPHELRMMVEQVKKLLAQGQSLEAIWVVHGDEFPVCVRTFYNYMEKCVMGLANIEPLKEDEAREVLEIVEARNTRGSLMLCSQFAAGGWAKKLGGGAIAEAIVDRIVRNSYVVHIEGDESMCKRMSSIG